MLGSSLVGRTLAWHGVPDEPGRWACSLGDEILAELEWSRSEAVRVEMEDVVWHLRFSGVLPLRAMLVDEVDVPRLLFAGAIGRGLARTREGRRFVLSVRASVGEGPWAEITDSGGDAVLRARRRMGPGIWSEVAVSPDPACGDFVVPLLLLWGGLQILRGRRPWLSLATVLVSERATRKGLDDLVSSLAL